MKGCTAPSIKHLPLPVVPPHEPQSLGDPSIKGCSALAKHHLLLSVVPPHDPLVGPQHPQDDPLHLQHLFHHP